jgi:hypothetical protein
MTVCVLGMCGLKPINMLPKTIKICFELKNVNMKKVRLIHKKPLFGPKSLRMIGKSGNILVLARSIPILA